MCLVFRGFPLSLVMHLSKFDQRPHFALQLLTLWLLLFPLSAL